MKFELPPLPYSLKALAPHISEATLTAHYQKHQKGYIDKLNEIPEVTSMGETDLESLVISAAHRPTLKTTLSLPSKGFPGELFDMAAQAYNHTFYWRSLRPEGGGDPDGEIAEGIRQFFGSGEKFRAAFKKVGMSLFGSGWVWLVLTQDDRLEIVKSTNAVTPLIYGMTPILVVDVWEHAYYLDRQNDRAAYLDSVLQNLLNWNFANENLKHIRS